MRSTPREAAYTVMDTIHPEDDHEDQKNHGSHGSHEKPKFELQMDSYLRVLLDLPSCLNPHKAS
jgi:hypothetical protein